MYSVKAEGFAHLLIYIYAVVGWISNVICIQGTENSGSCVV